MRFDAPFPGNNHIPGRHVWAHQFRHDDWVLTLRTIDDLGFYAVTTSEHLAMPHFEVPRLGAYWQYAPSVMAFIAGATRNVRIDAAVLVAPYHHPLIFAKELATIDVLSGGRLNVSIGTGHAEQEFAALGVPFADRGAITDETLEAMITLWTEGEPAHRGIHFAIDGLAFEPKPLQTPRPPIYVGGNAKPALRRAARYDGWQPNPMRLDIADLSPMTDYLLAQPGFEAKRDTFDINWTGVPASRHMPRRFAGCSAAQLDAWRDDLLEAYLTTYPAAGITRTAVPIPDDIQHRDEFLDLLRWFSATIIAPCAE